MGNKLDTTDLLLAGLIALGVYTVMQNTKKSDAQVIPTSSFKIGLGDFVYEIATPDSVWYARQRRVAANGQNEYLVTLNMDDNLSSGLWFYESQIAKE